ncbi:undecaprenyl-diphosphate phosphatase [Virgibacillus sp. MSJ-26]|uniref:undecaprenyl-diphosphate phosphatase n=1 Tax=Virgibacillus sp. MSJ-26 TaxID=2841522 RepID=UPI001C109A94|nr:undecaprenyl-diphosphate phosphatase [Virgibacillus sp. MSJ-26]MBU5468537.1 undecaprenyl-diphosphate phosphatase [Virgibacillus sp. MSJ-26]
MLISAKLWLLLKYFILGTVQGLTEPLPVSSSGHMVMLRHLFAIESNGLSFEILVNAASLLAILLIYRKDIFRLLKNGTRYLIYQNASEKSDGFYVVLLVIATVPTAITGLLFEDFISESLGSIKTVGVTLIVTAYALWLIRNLKGSKDDQQITIKDALIVGLAQSVALVPGISRSGATIVAAMLLGMKKESALRFSFLLYIPVSLGITILSIGDIVKDSQFNLLAIPYTIAFISSLIASFLALKWFINIMKKGKLIYFSLYCLAIGVLIIIFT